MKKLLLLLLSFVLLSCSKDDAPNDPIVATWKYSKMIKIPLQGEPVIVEGDECSKKTTMTFRNNGKLEVEYYQNFSSGCAINEIASGSFEWDRISPGFYNISRGGNTGTSYEMSFPNANTLHMTQQLATGNGQWLNYTYVYSKI